MLHVIGQFSDSRLVEAPVALPTHRNFGVSGMLAQAFLIAFEMAENAYLLGFCR